LIAAGGGRRKEKGDIEADGGRRKEEGGAEGQTTLGKRKRLPSGTGKMCAAWKERRERKSCQVSPGEKKDDKNDAVRDKPKRFASDGDTQHIDEKQLMKTGSAIQPRVQPFAR
jgi:hypothetical protein